MKRKLCLFAIGWLLGTSLSFANDLGCAIGDPTIMANSSAVSADYTDPGRSSTYQAYLAGGHSYAFEVWSLTAPDRTFSTSRPSLQLLNDFNPFCILASSTDVSAMTPTLSSGFSGRISWIQAADAHQYLAINNLDTVNGYSYNVRLVDTTLFNPRWSTYGGFTTQWGFNNLSHSAISGKLTIYDSVGNVLKSVDLTLAAGKSTFRTSSPSDLNLPANNVGSAMFAYVGPAGAIQADAYFLNANATVIVPSKFESQNAQF